MLTHLGALSLSVLSGFTIDLFFRFIRRHGTDSSPGPNQGTSGYLSVAELMDEDTRRRRIYYQIFRQVPPMAITVLLCGFLNEAFPQLWTLPYLLLAALISHAFSSFKVVFMKHMLLSLRLVHIQNICFSIIIAIAVEFFSGTKVIRAITPSLDGIVDNIWSSLFVSLIIVGYFELSKKETTPAIDNHRQIIAKHVPKRFEKLHKKFNRTVDASIGNDFYLQAIVWAILVFEDMNRPKLFRLAETTVVALSRKTMTIGVAQVRSSTPISDRTSIKIAVQSLRNFYEENCIDGSFQRSIQDIFRHHNPDDVYANNVYEVYINLPTKAHVIER